MKMGKPNVKKSLVVEPEKASMTIISEGFLFKLDWSHDALSIGRRTCKELGISRPRRPTVSRKALTDEFDSASFDTTMISIRKTTESDLFGQIVLSSVRTQATIYSKLFRFETHVDKLRSTSNSADLASDKQPSLDALFFVDAGELAGWLPDGTIFGPIRLTGKSETPGAMEAFARALRAHSRGSGQ